MGNGVGKILGVVAGAASFLIPGVGPLVGTLILAATTTAGSGVDALVDVGAQNSSADKAAEEQRRNATQEIERQRVAERQRLQDAARVAREQNATSGLEAERRSQAEIAERERQAAQARVVAEQLALLEQSLTACRDGDLSQVPARLQSMDAQTFNIFAAGALAACETADALEACRMILEQEQMRREVVQGWQQEVADMVAPNAAQRVRPTV